MPEIKLFDEKITNSKAIPIKTTLCQILDYPQLYEGELVIFEANAFVIDNEIKLDSYVRCQMNEDNFHFHLDNGILYPKLEMQEFKKKNSNLKTLLQMFQPVKLRAEVDVRVIGVPRRFVNKNSKFEYFIIPKEVEIISPFREFLGRSGGPQ